MKKCFLLNTKIDLREPKIQKCPWGACPQTPLAAAPFARTAPGLLSPILDLPLSRTALKLPPLPLLRDRVKDPNHRFLSATDSLAQDIPFHDIWIRHCLGKNS